MVAAEFSATCQGPAGMSQDEIVSLALEPAVRRGLAEACGSEVDLIVAGSRGPEWQG